MARKSSGSSGVTCFGPRASTRTSSKPARSKPARRSSSARRRSSRSRSTCPPDAARSGGPRRDLARSPVSGAAMLPSPPHCATSAPARPQRVVEAARTGDRDRGSSGRRRSRTPRRPARRARGRAGRRPEARPGRAEAPARPLDHRLRARRPRSRCPAGSRSTSSAVTRPVPQPASSTISSPAQRQALEDLGRPLDLRLRDAVVHVRVPLAGLRRARPRAGSQRRRHGPAVAPPAASKASIASARCERYPDVIEPVQQRCLISSSISNSDHPGGGVDGLLVDVDPRLARVRDPPAVLLVEDHRQQPVLGAVDVEDVGERRRDHRLEAEVLAAPIPRARARSRSRSCAPRPGSGSAPA